MGSVELRFALNRLDMSGPLAFAESAVRAEDLGWDLGLLPCNPLKVSDPYVCLAMAAQATTKLGLGTLLDTPVLRHPSVLAGSMATVAGLAPGRVQLGLGIGDTAVRFNGLAPATLDTLEATVKATKHLLTGAGLEVGAARPARLNHAAEVPVWVAAQGPKTLRMAGRVADGVWIRVGAHPDNLRRSWSAVLDGLNEAGRTPSEISLGLIFHTAYSPDLTEARTVGKAIAAGYYEYSKFLFDAPGFEWSGPDPEVLQSQVYPDFHHHKDMVHAGNVVSFLDDGVADAFALHGDWEQICAQLEQVLEQVRGLDLPVETIVLHPVLAPAVNIDFMSAAAEHVISYFR